MVGVDIEHTNQNIRGLLSWFHSDMINLALTVILSSLLLRLSITILVPFLSYWLVLLLQRAPIGKMPHLMTFKTRTKVASPLSWAVLLLGLNHLVLLLLSWRLLLVLTRSLVEVSLLLLLLILTSLAHNLPRLVEAGASVTTRRLTLKSHLPLAISLKNFPFSLNSKGLVNQLLEGFILIGGQSIANPRVQTIS